MKTSEKEFIVTNNTKELAEALGLDKNEGPEIEFRARLNIVIVKKFKESKYTQTELASIAGVSRTRLTALLNYNTQGLSTDFMLKVLGAMGYRADLKISKIA